MPPTPKKGNKGGRLLANKEETFEDGSSTNTVPKRGGNQGTMGGGSGTAKLKPLVAIRKKRRNGR